MIPELDKYKYILIEFNGFDFLFVTLNFTSSLVTSESTSICFVHFCHN